MRRSSRGCLAGVSVETKGGWSGSDDEVIAGLLMDGNGPTFRYGVAPRAKRIQGLGPCCGVTLGGMTTLIRLQFSRRSPIFGRETQCPSPFGVTGRNILK